MTTETMKNSGVEWIGNIPREWSISRLKDCLEIRNGKEVETGGGDIPVYGSGGVFGSTTSFLHDGESILFGRKGTIDKPLLAAGEFWTVDTMFYSVLRGNDNLKYLYYAALCIDFKSRQSGSTLPSMTQTALGGFFIPRPKLQEQQIIAAVLDEETGKIDRAIEIQRQQIETLEQLKTSIIHEAVTKGLDRSVPMKPSGVDWIGDIPEHWQIRRLKHVAELGSGTTPDSGNIDFYEPGEIPWIQSGDLYGADKVLTTEKLVTRKALINVPTLTVYRAPFVVVAMYGASVGNTSLSLIDACLNQACCRVSPRDDHDSTFFFYAIRASQDELVSQAQGGTQPNISQVIMKNHAIPIPPASEQHTIAAYLNDWYKRLTESISLKQKQIELLQNQRKSLIFEYVTGKRRVSEVA